MPVLRRVIDLRRGSRFVQLHVGPLSLAVHAGWLPPAWGVVSGGLYLAWGPVAVHWWRRK